EGKPLVLQVKGGGDGGGGGHSHGAGAGAGTAAAAPAGKGGAAGGSRRQGHHRAAIVGRRAGGPAVDPGGTRGHGATARPRLLDREEVTREGGAVVHKHGDGARTKVGHRQILRPIVIEVAHSD